MWKKKKECLREVNEQAKKLLIKVSLSFLLQLHCFEFHLICSLFPRITIRLIVPPLFQESFEGPVLIVPDLESTLHLKEDGKKVWRPRFFTLRASGIYYVPKGKTKVSCFWSTRVFCFRILKEHDVEHYINEKDNKFGP